ncbi:MAG: FKBP-type peptidyl-prolyl cis-trans isomerase [Clostridia bacterium]|nr:FKBP-type peptidyl-prolyl cis-trans isomerase [Clostridia bacterium]
MKYTGIIRIISVILAVCAGLFLLCSCGNESKDDTKTASATAEASSSNSKVSGETKPIDPSEYQKYGIVSLAPFSALIVEDETLTDDEVTSKIKQMLASYPGTKSQSADTAEKSDLANFDYTGYIDDKQFEGGTDTGAELIIGSNKFIPGFEDQLIGMKTGETKDIYVTFPENYQAKEYAGKDAKFVIKLNSLKRFALNDDNIKILSGLDSMTVEKFTEYIKKELRMSMLVNKNFDSYIALCKFDKLDQEKLDTFIENKRMADQYYASYYGKTVEQYTGYSGQAYEKFLTDYATARYKEEAVIGAIVELYSLSLTDDEITLGIHKYSADLEISAEQFQTSYSKDTIKNGLLNDKAMYYAADRFTIKK